MDKNEWLATNVLNWTLDDIACPPVYLKENGSTCIASSFQPDKHIIHAMMLLDAIAPENEYMIYGYADSKHCEIYGDITDYDTECIGSAVDKLLHKAITESVLHASGFYHE